MSKNRIVYLVVKNDESESYLYTDIRKVNKKVKDLNGECFVFEFRNTLNHRWESLYQKIVENKYREIQLYKDHIYTEEFIKILRYLKSAKWYSSINFPENGLRDCSYCGEEEIYVDIEICEECGKEMCSECREYREYYPEGVHEDCNDAKTMCHGEEDYDCSCEYKYCYNDECPMWNPEDYNGQTKSDYDENRAFIANLNPNDPADAWFFED